ncbi:MAG TPA: chemotaxis-specific protein-glutamate methyltransferase CheB [Kofleriaceae bacterium]|nr:chemotaxis-specific protein-glutamate methyltransferase CheB [Kofleriaceae bacterium]
MSGHIRVLVVEDSTTVRRHLCSVVARDPELELVGEAEDGRRAIELCQRLRPDVVTMDMMLPIMSGLAATEYIMAHCPTPILVVSASTNRGELFRTYEALAAGAVDVLEKPRGDEGEGSWEPTFVAAIKLVSRIRVITHPRGRLGAMGRANPNTLLPPVVDAPAGEPTACQVVAIGASTGGPGAVVTLLKALGPDFRLPLLLVLHIAEGFGAALADWLDGVTERRVVYARDGDPVSSLAGRLALAPPGHHLVVRDRRLRLTADPERHSCRPSVDVLFESIAREYGPAAVAALLTGMGRDGAAGLLDIRRAGGVTIAQDEESCVVYGMPREAVVLGAAARVLSLDQIGPALMSAARSQGAASGGSGQGRDLRGAEGKG